MEFFKRQSIGFYLSMLTTIVAILGAIMYMANCRTAYFANLGVNTIVIVCLCIAIVLELIYIIGNEVAGRRFVLDICPVAATVLITIATFMFISTRVNGIAAIMTFTNNASTMQDLNHTITTIILCVIAIILGMIASFFDIVKEAE